MTILITFGVLAFIASMISVERQLGKIEVNTRPAPKPPEPTWVPPSLNIFRADWMEEYMNKG